MESTATTQELLERNKTWAYVRTDRNGTRYFTDCRCERCGGRGGWEGWPDFTCYECGGSGISTPKEFKVYTPEHAAKLKAQREARAQKAEVERQKKAIAERGDNLIKAGFGLCGDEYVIYRIVGKTYAIKDQLKALGCKFKPQVGWYSSKPLEDYECQQLKEKDVLTDSVYIEWKDINEIEPLLIENVRRIEESTSEWQSEVGKRIKIKVHIDRRFKNEYQRNNGWYGISISYMYLMTDANGNKYKWSTGKYYDEDIDMCFNATVKEHTEYKGVKQTVVTRCTPIEKK